MEKLRPDKTFTYQIITYGCQMNVRDSEKMGAMLESIGGLPAGEGSESGDVILYNTCCIREHAEDRVFGNVGRLRKAKRENPEKIIGVCGCMMQQSGAADDFLRRFDFVELIFGTHNMHKLPEYVGRIQGGEKPIVEIFDKEQLEQVQKGLLRTQATPSKFVDIMQGCDNYCTYCIVPFVRGRERSRKKEEIVDEVRQLVKGGTREIVLLGQNVNSYAGGGDAFAELLRELDRVPGIARIRFMTSHPKDLSDSLISAMAQCRHVCKQLHLPVQSGSNDVLRRMNRKYTREHYLGLVRKLREKMPHIGLTTDIIVGFPGETDEDFEQTLELIRQVRFHSGYLFGFSARRGTAADKMADQVPELVKRERLQRLIGLQRQITAEINAGYVGQTCEVLVEKAGGQARQLVGRTDCGRPVHFGGSQDKIGQLVDVTIGRAKGNILLGTMAEGK
ncbi:MAG: tRNA (N6-isopentenyl adenosine(37)-C2)-methylthiotransferase MiaB [Christensenellales bacterium]|jgi:tRNA-2-methylthio-N6-dimethylallyladenosine synthase